MIPTLQHIKNSTAAGAMAVWMDGLKNGARLEVGRSLSGYSVFRYYNGCLLMHRHRLSINEAAGVIDRWIAEIND